VQGDFFKDTWLEKLQLPRNSFDLIYDYTVCGSQKSFVQCTGPGFYLLSQEQSSVSSYRSTVLLSLISCV
jgi:hypothetical protein